MKYIIVIFIPFIIALFVSPEANADQQITMKIEGMTCKL